MPAPTLPPPSLPSYPPDWNGGVAALFIDRRSSFEYGEHQSQLRQQAKRMAYSELLYGWGGGGVGAAKVCPMLGVDTHCLPTPPTVAVNTWRRATYQPWYQ